MTSERCKAVALPDRESIAALQRIRSFLPAKIFLGLCKTLFFTTRLPSLSDMKTTICQAAPFLSEDVKNYSNSDLNSVLSVDALYLAFTVPQGQIPRDIILTI